MENFAAMDKIRSIHYLRGIAALLVVCFHLRVDINGVYAQSNLGNLLFDGGASGVDLFFIISGFIITMSADKNNESFTNFAIKRIFRIYPVFISMLILFVVINNYYSFGEIIRSAFFINTNFSREAPFFGYNILVPAWTLTYEVYFYIIFSISIFISQKNAVYISSALLITPVIAYQLFFNHQISLDATMQLNVNIPIIGSLMKLQSSPMMIEFVYGMFLYKLYTIDFHIKHYKILSFSLISIYVYSFFSGYRYGYGPINFGFWALMIFIGCLLYEKHNKLRDNAVLNSLGNYSYSIYLSQLIVTSSFYHIKNDLGLFRDATNGFSSMIFTISTIIVFSYFLYHFIEKPSIKAGRYLCDFVANRANKIRQSPVVTQNA